METWDYYSSELVNKVLNISLLIYALIFSLWFPFLILFHLIGPKHTFDSLKMKFNDDNASNKMMGLAGLYLNTSLL